MKKVLSLLLTLAMICLPVSTTARPKTKLIDRAFSATAELFITNPNDVREALGIGQGSDAPLDVCTAWNVYKTADGYDLITAEHCISLEGVTAQVKAYKGKSIQYAISYDNPTRPISDMVLIPVEVVQEGNEDDFELDIAELHAKTNIKQDVLEIGDESELKIGDEVIDVSAPGGGEFKFMSEGYVAQSFIREKDEKGSAWFIIPGTNPGSSGSAIISEETGKVVSLLNVGVENAGGVSGVKASKILSFLNDPYIPPVPVQSQSTPGFDYFAFLPQRGHGGHGNQHGENHGNGNRGRGSNHDRGPRYSGRDYHHHVGRADIRHIRGREDVLFGGVWFTCGIWPDWFFGGEVFIEDINGEWFFVSYDDPRLMLQVTIVE